MTSIYLPTTRPDDWKRLLAKPDLHWKPGYSAWAVAHAWEAANGVPSEIARLFENSDHFKGQRVELLLATPEHQVPLPPKSGHPSQNDVFALIRVGDQIISTTIEGKVKESFGPTMTEWWGEPSDGKSERLNFLCDQLGLQTQDSLTHSPLRYQLLHRAVSAIIEAKRFNADYAAMIVHSFARDEQWRDEVDRFLHLFRTKLEADRLVRIPLPHGRTLFIGAAMGAHEHRDGRDRDRKDWEIRSAVYKACRRYLDGFSDGKMDSINAVVQYPLTVISDGQAHDVYTFPINPAELIAKTGWHATVDNEIDVVAVSETKAHVILRNARRLRQDGSLIETVSGFYAFTKTDDGAWRMFAISAITDPE